MTLGPRQNWKVKKAKIALMAKQTPQQLALRRSREMAVSLRRAMKAGLVPSLSELLAMAEAQESKELRGSVSHEALKLALEARNKSKGAA
ncbi:hypothetical protein GCM10022421_32220 [Oceanisphaera sediminis]|uniref:Uncharacterized protein n=1 Tax=Oceanisphaera sediminis TaxID=981381 RepID=A0ABP7EMM1_9GAMM